MGERTTTRFQPLFAARLLHHYWLDQGATVFDQIADQAKQDARLLAYDMRSFLDVRPTASTEKALSSFRCLFRKTALGLVVAAPSAAIIPADTTFEFIVSIKGRQFTDYTSLTLRPQTIHELFNAADGVTYRYKENVAVLSNLTGSTRGTGANAALFLSREIPAQGADDSVESLVRSGNALLQLTSDSPGAATQQLGAQAADLPVYLHQADAPALVPPAGLAGVPARGVRLSADISDDIFALIRVTAVRADNDAFSFVDAGGAPRAAPPTYQVRFRNRSTVWTYLDKRTGAVTSISTDPLPLTFFGNAGTKQKPSTGFVTAEMSGTKIQRLISDIYV